MSAGVLADLIVVAHLLVVGYVIGGQLAVRVGWAAGWGWVRNLWFRLSHLAVILVVAGQSALDQVCPLTTWELALRREAGEQGYEGSFIGHLLRDLLYVDVPLATLNIVYIAFAGLVALSLFMVPPRRRRPADKTAASA